MYKKIKQFIKKLLWPVAILILMVSLTGCGNYSNGNRVGNITKFSEKGIIWKTWEGQLHLGGISNEFPLIFDLILSVNLKEGAGTPRIRLLICS